MTGKFSSKFPIYIFITIIFIIFNSCGYKPSSHYTDEVIGKKIYASVSTLIEEPEISILIEDALKDALRVRLNVSFSDKEKSDSTLQLSLKKLEFKPLQTDGGYTVLYRTELILKARLSFIKKWNQTNF